MQKAGPRRRRNNSDRKNIRQKQEVEGTE